MTEEASGEERELEAKEAAARLASRRGVVLKSAQGRQILESSRMSREARASARESIRAIRSSKRQ